jgi:hypothetical protein
MFMYVDICLCMCEGERGRERERQRHILYIVYICISTHPCTLCVRSSHPLCSCAREQREHEKEFNTTVASLAGAPSAYEDALLQVLVLYTPPLYLLHYIQVIHTLHLSSGGWAHGQGCRN